MEEGESDSEGGTNQSKTSFEWLSPPLRTRLNTTDNEEILAAIAAVAAAEALEFTKYSTAYKSPAKNKKKELSSNVEDITKEIEQRNTTGKGWVFNSIFATLDQQEVGTDSDSDGEMLGIAREIPLGLAVKFGDGSLNLKEVG